MTTLKIKTETNFSENAYYCGIDTPDELTLNLEPIDIKNVKKAQKTIADNDFMKKIEVPFNGYIEEHENSDDDLRMVFYYEQIIVNNYGVYYRAEGKHNTDANCELDITPLFNKTGDQNDS